MPRLQHSPYEISASTVDDGDLDRMAEFRDDAARMARLWHEPSTRAIVVRDGRAVLDEGGLVRLPVDQVPPGARMLLGVGAAGALFVVHPSEPLPRGSAHSLRSAAGMLSAADLGIFLHAAALTAWHERHPRCPRCGDVTDVVAAGYGRRCRGDGSEHYPRTDPAVIVLVRDAAPTGSDRALLGRQASWPPGRFSTLAGFVEPGETVEDAVAREVAEEVGLRVTDVAYAGSQPWPFPASLMLAYYATVDGGADHDLSCDGEEIVEARWFTRDSFRAATADGDVLVPPRLSVARRLIEGWLGEPVARTGTWR